jgi:hypothetical protein
MFWVYKDILIGGYYKFFMKNEAYYTWLNVNICRRT